MRAVAGKNTLYQQHLYSPKISMHIYKPKKLNEWNLCGLRDWIFSSPSTPICAPKLASDRLRLRTQMPVDKREKSGFNSKESSSRELKERVLVWGSVPTVHFANGPKWSKSKDTDQKWWGSNHVLLSFVVFTACSSRLILLHRYYKKKSSKLLDMLMCINIQISAISSNLDFSFQ